MKPIEQSVSGYDIIGDVHGCADALAALFEKLGYSKKDGVYYHPDRQVVFLGDIVDRGPHIREALHMVKDMVDRGCAHIVLGNHEYNAITYTTPAPDDFDSEFLRPHTTRQNKVIQQTLDQFANYPQEWQAFLQWFQEIPVFLEFENFRTVHACWDDYLIQQYKDDYKTNTVSKEFIVESCIRGTFAHRFLDRLTRGTDMPLPGGATMVSADGYERRHFRTKFWSGHPLSYGDVVFQPDPLPQYIIEMPISDENRLRLVHYGLEEPPVFVGHYWLEGVPRPLTPNVACLDFSAVKRGRLTAYRFDGETTLENDKFVWVYNDLHE